MLFRSAAQDTRRLSADDAVRLALENNLGLQVARLNPQLQDLSVAQAQAAWVPTLTSTVQTSSTDTPNTSFLSGSQGNKTTDKRTLSNLGVTQLTPWGGSYSVGWDASRATTTNIFSNFSPQLRSSLSLDIKQPLLKNWKIDSARQQVMVSQKNREIADLRSEEHTSELQSH